MPISPEQAMSLNADELRTAEALITDLDRILAARYDGVTPAAVNLTELPVRENGEVTPRVAQEVVRRYRTAGWSRVEFVRDQEEKRDTAGAAYTVLRDRFVFGP